MKPHPEISVTVLVRQINATKGMATFTVPANRLGDLTMSRVLAEGLRPAFEQAILQAGLPMPARDDTGDAR